MNNFLNKFKQVLRYLERPDIPLYFYLLSFLFATTLRDFLETYFNGEIRDPGLAALILHYDISYVCLAMALVVLFYFAVKENIVKIAKVILPCFLILILAPIIDLVLVHWRTFNIGYMFPDTHENILFRFLTFFGPLDTSGVTPGMRLEIFIALCVSFCYFFAKSSNIVKSIIFTFLTYSLIFVYCAIPFLYKAVMDFLYLDPGFSQEAITQFFLLLGFVLGVVIFYLNDKNTLKDILKDIRFFRLLHFEMMFILGILISKIYYGQDVVLNSRLILIWPLIMISIACGWIYSVMTNNISDIEIDIISNNKRPTVTKAIEVNKYKKLSWLFLFCAVVFSLAVNVTVLFLVLVFIGNYFIYSMPPLRLKRIPFFSKLIISFNSLVLMVVGLFSHSGNFGIPFKIIFYFIVFFTAAVNFIDLKDHDGDKKAGIKTLPTLLGLRQGKILIGCFFIVAYFFGCYAFDSKILLLPALIVGAIQFYFITKEKYKEDVVFIFYHLSIIILILSKLYFNQG